MMSHIKRCASVVSAVLALIAFPGLLSQRAIAQVTPDGSLSTTVTQSGNDFTIDNGNRAGNNLFHSFDQFSVPTAGSAIFNNTVDVQNIFGRVTGGNVSNIDGAIRANGTANLFLLNPSGILFGPNASLNIGGSFIGTTANSIKFADGVEFGATNATGTSLLTMSVPIGLQMGANAGPIQVQGPTAPNALFRPPTLSVAPTQTLALVGGQIDINSANVSAPNGRIELWAVRDAQIAMNTQPWQLTNVATTPNWGTITLQQASFVDASGTNGGAINIRGRGLTVQDGSDISSITFAGQGKGITVQTTEFVDLLGLSLPGRTGAGITTNVGVPFGPSGSGRAGNVTVETGRLRLAGGAWFGSSSNGNNSRSGDVAIRATDVEVVGAHPVSFGPSAITTTLFSGKNNQSGTITVEADRIRLLEGGLISSALISLNPAGILTGNTGDILIRATESLEISGYTPNQLLSGVGTGISHAEGQAGNITIDVGRLQLSNGGTIRTTLTGIGKAGNITIHATDVTVSDPVVDVLSQLPGGINVAVGADTVGSGGDITLTANSLRLFNGGQIASSSQGQGSAGNVILNVNTIDVQGVSQFLVNGQYLPSTITASSSTAFDAGSVNITANALQVSDAAQISVSNTGTGNAGNLNIDARTIFLDNAASLRAEVNGGSQGNLNLQAQGLLSLRHGSNITTNAQGASTGGDININAGFIVGISSENSDIVANAIQGQGGNIQIATQGIFGLQFWPQLTPLSDITASSQFGVSGIVQITTPGLDVSSGLVELPTTLADASQQIAQGCSTNQGSSFVATGRGGLPLNPTQQVRSDRPWADIRDLDAYSQQPATQTAPAAVTAAPLIQATGWQQNANGQVELLASTEASAVATTPVATCSAASASLS